MRKPLEFEEHPISFTTAEFAGLTRGYCHHVTDGDTIDVFLDLGFHNYAYETLRIHGIDAPEIFRPKSDEEREAGERAKARVVELCLDRHVLVRSYKDRQTFGRFVADVYVPPSGDPSDIEAWLDLSDVLVAENLALPV